MLEAGTSHIRNTNFKHFTEEFGLVLYIHVTGKVHK
jgi:hypothetical protein